MTDPASILNVATAARDRELSSMPPDSPLLRKRPTPKTDALPDPAQADAARIAEALAPFSGMPIVTPAMLEAVARAQLAAIREFMAVAEARSAPAGGAAQGGQPKPKPLLNRNDCAKALGISCTTLDLMRKRPRFPEIHLGGKKGPRFDVAEIRAWLEREWKLEQEMRK